MPVFLKYYVYDFSKHNSGFADVDAIGNLCSQIARNNNLVYGVDFELSDIAIEETGHRYISIAVRDEKMAMMIKLKGVTTVSA